MIPYLKEDDLVTIETGKDSLIKDSVVAPVIVAADNLPPVADSSKKGIPRCATYTLQPARTPGKDYGNRFIVIGQKRSQSRKDSTDRYFGRYRNVRIFSDSMQV